MSATGPNWRSLGLDLVTLRILMAAIDEKSLARAALREKIAVSAASRRISEFEARIGVILLERHDRGVSPTAAGAATYVQIRNMFDLLNRLAEDLQSIKGGSRGYIRLHTHMSATAGVLPELLAGFLTEHPGIDLEIEEHTSLDILHAIRTGTADVGLVSGSSQPDDLHMIQWQLDILQVILPTGHTLLEKTSISFADLAGEPFIGMQRDSALLSLYRDHAKALGRTLKERCHATSFDSVRRMVSAGLGVSILPAVAAQPRAGANFESRPLAESWAHRPLALCIRHPEQLSAAARHFVDYLLRSHAATAKAPLPE